MSGGGGAAPSIVSAPNPTRALGSRFSPPQQGPIASNPLQAVMSLMQLADYGNTSPGPRQPVYDPYMGS